MDVEGRRSGAAAVGLARAGGGGFTLIELLVVIGIVALLIGILIGTLGPARDAARLSVCAAREKDLGVGVRQFLSDHNDALPQVQVDAAGQMTPQGEGRTVGTLFGGKIGRLQAFGINRVGAERRPLNPYVGVTNPPPDPRDASEMTPEAVRRLAESFQTEMFEDPADRGTTDPFVDFVLDGVDRDAKRRMYELLGTSYILNDHAINSASAGTGEIPTLVPCRGGRMPTRIDAPSLTTLLACQSLYNYDGGSDRGMAWHGGRVRVNMLFVDLHVGTKIDIVAPGDEDSLLQGDTVINDEAQATNLTREYRLLPREDWLERDEGQPCPDEG